MQAVILAAGKGTRLWPLTSTKPKPFIRVLGKTILEHNLEQLTPLVDEVILVVGYKGEAIKDFIGENYKGVKITYAWQQKLLGTGDALIAAKPFLKDKFLVLNGDDFYFSEDLRQGIAKFPSILVKEIKDPRAYACVITENGLVKDITEKPEKVLSNLANIGVYFFDKSVFDINLEKSLRGEYEITDFVKYLARNKTLYFHIAKNWFPGSYPWNFLDVNEFLLKRIKTEIKGKVAKGCKIIEPVVILEGSIIDSGTEIKGPAFIDKNCHIGKDCRIESFTSIGRDCGILNKTNIINSIISDRVEIGANCAISHSILGESCRIYDNVSISSCGNSGDTVKAEVKGKIVDTKKANFGCAVGDGTEIKEGAKVIPGVLIGTGCKIGFGLAVGKNIKDGECL